MRRIAIGAAMGVLLLGACDNQPDPSPPPTTEDALTTATETATPAPPPVEDETEATTEAEPEAAPVTEEEPDTEAATTEAPAPDDGPPEMPEEAKEQTEAGAEAFALHYIDLVNYTGKHPTTGLLEPLAQDSCQSCNNRVESVEYGVEHGDHLLEDTFEPDTPSTLLISADTARVEVPITQVAQNYFRDGEALERNLTPERATLAFRLQWEDEWRISEITVGQ